MRQGDEVAGGKIDGIALVDFALRAALAEQVVDDHVGPVASEQRRKRRGLGCQDTPGLRELAVQVDRRIDLGVARSTSARASMEGSLLEAFGGIGQIRETRGQALRRRAPS